LRPAGHRESLRGNFSAASLDFRGAGLWKHRHQPTL